LRCGFVRSNLPLDILSYLSRSYILFRSKRE
jgi:hypothetical protein